MQINVNWCIPSDLSSIPEERSATKLEIEENTFSTGGQGNVYEIISINGKKVSGLLAKHFPRFPSNLKSLVETIRINKDKYQIDKCSALTTLPLFLFEGTLNQKSCQGYVMRRVHGKPFKDIIEKEINTYINLPFETRLSFCYQFVEAMHILHSLTIVHADINAENLLVDMNRGMLYVIDLDGGAVAKEEAAPVVIGKMDSEWLAHEIWVDLKNNKSPKSNINVKIYSDFWSTTCGIHYLLFGVGPFFFIAEQPDKTRYLNNNEWPQLQKMQGIKINNQHIFNYYKNAYDKASFLQEYFKSSVQKGYLNTGMRLTPYLWLNALKPHMQPFQPKQAHQIPKTAITPVVQTTPISVVPNIPARKRRNKFIAAGVGILALFIIVSIIVSNVGRKNDKHSQPTVSKVEMSDKQIRKKPEETPDPIDSSVAVVFPLRPDSARDVWVTSYYDYGDNFGVNDKKLQVGGWGDWYYSLLEFRLDRHPNDVKRVLLELYCYPRGDKSLATEMYLDRLLAPWDEDASWRAQPDAATVAVLAAPTHINDWYRVDITELYRGWITGTYPNYGVRLRPLYNNNRFNVFYSTEYSQNPDLRPRLVIEPAWQAISPPGQTTATQKLEEQNIPQERKEFHTALLQSYNYPAYYIKQKNFLGELTMISSDMDKKDATFRIVSGLADDEYISFESVKYPKHYLRHQYSRIELQKYRDEQSFKVDATFKLVPGLVDSTFFSFQSYNYPEYFIRHKDFLLYIDKVDDNLSRKDSTFIMMPPLPSEIFAQIMKRVQTDEEKKVNKSLSAHYYHRAKLETHTDSKAEQSSPTQIETNKTTVQEMANQNTILSEDEVKAAIEKWVNLRNKKGSIDEIMQLYADKLDFQDKGYVTKDFVKQNMIDFQKMWSDVEYKFVSPIKVSSGNADDKKTAKFTLHKISRNDQVTAESDMQLNFTLYKQENSIVIIKENLTEKKIVTKISYQLRKLSKRLQKGTHITIITGRGQPTVFYTKLEQVSSDTLKIYMHHRFDEGGFGSLNDLISCEWSSSALSFVGVWDKKKNMQIYLKPEYDSSGYIKSFDGYIEGGRNNSRFELGLYPNLLSF